MNIYDATLWINDVNTAIIDLHELDDLAGHVILITGSTGLICSAVVDLLIAYNEKHENKIIIYAAGRDEKRVMQRFHPFSDREYFQFIRFDACSRDNLIDCEFDYAIHGAGISDPKMIMQEPVETMMANLFGLRELLEKSIKRKTRILCISSSEVYGKQHEADLLTENDYGSIDILNPRSSYSIAKQAAETLCVSYHQEYGVDSVIVRPGHIYGPNAKQNDSHIIAIWSQDAASGKSIVMKSQGTQIRSYVYSLDCATAIIKVLIHGKSAQAYNISNDDSIISIKDMAGILTAIGNVELVCEAPKDEEKKAFNPNERSALASKKIVELGWKPLFSIRDGLEHTVKILKEIHR